jgi:hypothetical protein
MSQNEATEAMTAKIPLTIHPTYKITTATQIPGLAIKGETVHDELQKEKELGI